MIGRTLHAAYYAVVLVSLATAQAPQRPTAAVVNGVKIPLSDLEAELRQSGETEPPSRARRMETLGMLIDNLLLKQFLDKNLDTMSESEIARRLADFEAGLIRQKKSLLEFCHETNQTPEQVKAGIIQQVRWATFAANHLNDAYLEQYYKDNKDFFDKITVRASHIVFRVAPSATPEEKERLRAELVKLRQRLLTDDQADFAELAKKHSHGPNAANGGDVGYFPRKWAFDESFARAAFGLGRVGQISEVVETSYGLHLIKLTDRKAGEPSNLARTKEAVRAFCSEDLRQTILTEQRKSAWAGRAITIELP